MSKAPDPPPRLGEARVAVSKVLDAIGVTCIVAVDDDWVLADPGPIIQAAASKKIANEVFSGDPADYAAWVEERWPDVLETEAIQLRVKAANARPDLTADALDVLAALCKGHVSFKALTPDQWHQEQAGLVEKHSAERMLVLFDRFIDGDPEVGEALLEEFLTDYPNANAAMFTSETTREQELEDQKRVAEALKVPIEKILLASKEHLTHERAPEFADFLRHTANAKHLRVIRDAVVRLATEGHTVAAGRIRDMSLRVLEDIVLRSSRREGAYEADTMLRTLNIEVAAQVRESLARGEAPELADAIREARKLAEASFLDHPDSREEAEALLAKERFETHDTVNVGGLPLTNGDVFEVRGALYALFEPPCDMVMRDDVSDSRDHKHAKLVALVGAEGESRQRAWKLPGYAPFGGDSQLYALFSETLSLPLRILDLCSFNADGQARINIDADSPEVEPLTPGLSKRYDQLSRHARELRDLAQQVADSSEVRSRLLQIDELQGELDGSCLSWPVRRRGRLARPVAAAGLAAESADASRPANLHDLDRFDA